MPFWPTKPIRYLSSIGTPCHFWLNQMSFWLGYSFLSTFWLNVQFDTWSNRSSWSNCLIKNYTCHLKLELPIKMDMLRSQKGSFSQVVWFDKLWILIMKKRKNIQVVMVNPFWRFHKLLSRVEFLMIWYN
jgi:hypothetical protein